MKKIVLLSMMISSSMMIPSAIAAIGQTSPNVIDKSINSQSSKSLKELRNEVRSESKAIEGSLDDHIRKLREMNYRVDKTDGTTEKALKQVLVIDGKFKDHLNDLASKVLALKDGHLIEVVRKNAKDPLYFNDKYDDSIISMIRFVSTERLNKVRQSYVATFDEKAVDYYLNALSKSLNTEDSVITTFERLFAGKRQILEEQKKQEHLAEIARQERIEQNNAIIREQNRKIEIEEQESQRRLEEAEAKEIAILSSLPSKNAVEAKYRNYKHKTGHVFEMFPVGFVPKNNKGFNDYVTIWGKKYRARYRETDPSGQVHTLIIEFYDSGNVNQVSVYDGTLLIYNAKYADGASKPFEVRARTKDHKYYSVLRREYNYEAGKVVKTFEYQDVATGFWVR